MSFSRDDLIRLLREARERGATEVHFKVPNRVMFRIDGVLLPQGTVALTPALGLQAAMTVCGLANLEVALASLTDREFSFGLGGIGRFHAKLYRQRGSIAMIVQRSGLDIPALADLGFSPEVEGVLGGGGLVVVAGGPRRQAVLAALVDRYNASQRGFVVVLEDPLHYLHRDAMACIAQRGVGTDVPTLVDGIRTATRQLPDLLACGPIADREATEAMLEALENGVPVIATLAASRPDDAIPFLTRHYAVHDRDLVAGRIGRHLKATLCIPVAGPTEVVRYGK
jgi:twitching motility protein PilT